MTTMKREGETYVVPILKCDEPTPLGRVYPKEVVAKAITEVQQQIQDRRFFGYRDPEKRSLAEVTHLVTGLKLRGNTLEALIEPLGTPHGTFMGNVLRDWARTPKSEVDKFPYRFSPRGFGTEKEKPDGTFEVLDYKFDSINLVLDHDFDEK